MGRPMVHLITLDTRLLAAEIAEAYREAGVVVVAVFLSDLIDHRAFAPDNEHCAIVQLTAEELARGAEEVEDDDVTSAGVAHEAVVVAHA
jgi:hypothetical protein